MSKPFSLDELQLRFHNLISRRQKLGDYDRKQFALPGESTPDTMHASGVEPLKQVTDSFLLWIYGLVDQHLDDPTIGVEWMADQLAMNSKTLYRKVHAVIQLAPTDLVRQYRLRRAAELLKAGHNVNETVGRVGFNTPSHFRCVFRETY